MRKVEAVMIQAIRDLIGNADFCGSYKRIGNTEVRQWHDGPSHTPGYRRVIEVRLHGNTIAHVYPDISRIFVRDCGWRTATTKSRLNAILGALGGGDQISQVRGEWRTSRGEWIGTGYDWQDCHWQLRLNGDNPMLQTAERLAA